MKSEGEEPERVLGKGWMGDRRGRGLPRWKAGYTHCGNNWRKNDASFPSFMGFPGGSVVENSPANAGDLGSIPGSG